MFVEIKFATDSLEEARKIGNILLNKKLVACAQIFAIESHYVWKKERCVTNEYMVTMKTKRKLFKMVEKVIKENHSYEVAEIIAVPIAKGSREFFKWIEDSTI